MRGRRGHLIQGSALLLVPVCLILIHFLMPMRIQEQLVFYYSDPGLVTAWTAAYLHADDGHLFRNLFGYVLTIGPAYVLYKYWGRQRDLWVTVGILLVVTPFVTRVADNMVLHVHLDVMAADAASRGFSGIASAFGGLLLAAAGLFVADEYDRLTAWHATLLIVCAGLAVLTITFGVFSPMVGGLLLVGVAALAAHFLSLADLRNVGQFRTRIAAHRGNILYVAYCGIVVSIFIALIFPAEIAQNGELVNVISHGTGFIVGVFVTILVSFVRRAF